MKRTYQPSKIKRARKHGFRKRIRENQTVIQHRRQKGRWSLTV